MKLALIVGINHYDNISSLHGCVNDANIVAEMLERNEDGTKNFDCNVMTASAPAENISKRKLKDAITQVFQTRAEVALFYFAGHGFVDTTGGFLLTSDANEGDEGVSLHEILLLANNSPANNKIIVLDSCHSGIAGDIPGQPNTAQLSEGITILTASAKDQYASEKCGSGVFTTLLVDALRGSAANLMGEITPGSVYAHIDQSLGAWEQRPIFKTNIRKFISLRKVPAPIQLEDLKAITKYFTNPGFEFQLDPTYEPETKGREEGHPAPIDEHTHIFATLQKYNRLNLLVPVGVPHMWNAAMESKTCKLTALGEHYRQLVENGRI